MQEVKRKKKRRFRLPNGVGSVHQIGDGKRRRNPWRARVPSHVEIDMETGKAVQKYITVGYYPTEVEAIDALMNYRKNPFTLEAATCTFEDLFQMWKAKKYPDVSKHAQAGYNSAFKNSAPLHKMKVRDIRASHLESVMQSIEGGYQVQARLKTFWGQMFKYAMEHDIIQKNYADFVKTRDKDEGTKRTAIPPEGIKKIWAEIDAGNIDAEIAMIYIYTGFRPSELLEVQKKNVDLDARIMIGGKKTRAGKMRHVPIHTCILPFVKKFMETPGETLIAEPDGSPVLYEPYRAHRWNPLMKRLELPKYTMHYTRHTCATLLREANVAEDIRKLILGHKSGDITDRYTHHPDSMLVAAMDTVPGR